MNISRCIKKDGLAGDGSGKQGACSVARLFIPGCLNEKYYHAPTRYRSDVGL